MATALRRGACLLVVGLAVGLSSAGAPGVPQPEKGQPFPGVGRTVPYEAALDHCDLVLVGKVTDLKDASLREVGDKTEGTPGSLELAVEKVLKGECADKKVTITFGGSGLGLKDRENPQAFLCIRKPDGKLILAGDPPDGGGWVREGPALGERLIEAAKDPQKGYDSKDVPVKLSSAYRLAEAWVAAPADKKPRPPPGLVETLMEGLRPDEQWRGKNVNAADRDALHHLLDCNVVGMFGYAPRHRDEGVNKMKAAWERTVALVQERRKAPKDVKPDPATMLQRKHAAEYLAKLASKDKNERIDAGRELTGMEDVGLDALAAGMKGKDPEVAALCRQLRRQVFENRAVADSFRATFDPDVAAPFVPAEGAPTSAPAPPEAK